MKYKGDIKEITVTQTALGAALGISQQRINQLADEEICVRDEFDKQGGVFLFDSLKNYFLSKNQSATGGVNFWAEKALNEKAKREMNELKLQQARGELYVAADVESAFVEMLTALRSNLLALPAKLSAQLEGKSREEIYRSLNAELEERLEELSSQKCFT